MYTAGVMTDSIGRPEVWPVGIERGGQGPLREALTGIQITAWSLACREGRHAVL